MSRATYYTAITLFCLLLPASVAVPYLFYGEGFKILKWAWVEGYLPFWVSFCFSAAMGLICFVLLVRLQHMGRILFTVTTVISILASAVIAMVEQRHLSLVVVIFFLACILVYASEWIRKALDLPYFRSHRAWWEARPKGVPGVSARILYTRGKKQQSHPVRVVNFGKEGCFVFFENAAFAIDPQSIEFDSSCFSPSRQSIN